MNWVSFIYQYAVGGAIFSLAVFLAWRSGDYSWKNREDRATALFLVTILLFYFCGHLVWQILATGGS
jgi:hypothetical protein